MTEAELVEQAQQGDEAAWLALVRQEQEKVFRLAYLLVRDADEAEDVAQEALIRAYRFLHHFDRNQPLRPWLLRITRNVALNNIRAWRRYAAALMRRQRQEGAVASARMADAPVAETDALGRALRRLPVQDQEVIYLRFYLELSVAETATALAIAEGTVKSRLSRALSRLRPLLEAEQADEGLTVREAARE